MLQKPFNIIYTKASRNKMGIMYLPIQHIIRTILESTDINPSRKCYFYHNVINLRKRTMPDIITPLYRVKIFGIALDMKSS